MKKDFCLNPHWSHTKVSALIVILILFSGCTNTSTKATRAQTAPDLKNVTLNITDLAGRPARLVNGMFKGDHLIINVVREAAADLNQDGLIDGAIIIFENSGGSGNFRELCLLLNNGNHLIQADQAYIGDRIGITDLNINKNVITINYLDRNKNDPYSIAPYIKKKVCYRVKGGKLDKLNIK